jgi:hypothetical protein
MMKQRSSSQIAGISSKVCFLRSSGELMELSNGYGYVDIDLSFNFLLNNEKQNKLTVLQRRYSEISSLQATLNLS